MPNARVFTVKLLRHGQTQSNADDRMTGSSESPLTALGREQAAMAAEALRDWPIHLAYASTLSRTIETAEIILRYHPGTPLKTDPRIVERYYGSWQGKSFSEIKRGDEAAEVEANVETRPATGQRMLLFWNDLLEELASSPPSLSNVLISNHGASIRYFLQALRNQEPRVVAFPKVDSGEERLPNCSITTLKMALHDDGSWGGALLEWGASAHLRVKTATGDDAA